MQTIKYVFITLFLSSCTATKSLISDYSSQQCEETTIKSQVYDMGKKGEPEDKVLKFYDVCVKEFQALYKQRDILRSYKDGLKKYCLKSEWERVGESYGNEGKEYSSELDKIKVCQLQNISTAQNGLRVGHKNGLRKYCDSNNWESKGFEEGRVGGNFNKFDEQFAICNYNRVSSAKNGFGRGYEKGIKLFCQTNDWRNQAIDLAKRGQPIEPLLKRAQLCVHHQANRNTIRDVRAIYLSAQDHYCQKKYAYEAGQKGLEFEPANCPSENVEVLTNEYEKGQKDTATSNMKP